MLEKAISGRKVKSGGKCRAAKTKIQLQLEIVDEVEKLLNCLICNTHTQTHTHLGKENKKAAKRTHKERCGRQFSKYVQSKSICITPKHLPTLTHKERERDREKGTETAHVFGGKKQSGAKDSFKMCNDRKKTTNSFLHF